MAHKSLRYRCYQTSQKKKSKSYIIDEHEYVNLDLPSGTLWAKMNVGAESETDAGLYFTWGETEGYADASTKAFTENDYKFNPSRDNSTFTKYNSTDNKTVLDIEDDAAAVNMGDDWHMPTKEQCDELFNTEYVTNTFIENYQDSGINGYLFTSVSNGNTLFIPAGGNYNNGEIWSVGESGSVWSSSLYTDNINNAQNFIFSPLGASVSYNDRYSGRSVRGVID